MAKLGKYMNLMIDVETYALDDNAVILSAGMSLCDRDWNEVDSFYINIDVDEQIEAGRNIDENTVEWWSRQSPRAIATIWNNPEHRQVSPETAASEILAFIDRCKSRFGAKNILYWGNSAEFDVNKINTFLFDFVTEIIDDVIDGYYKRCFKTTRDICESYFGIRYSREDVLHDALADARQQCEFMKRLKSYSPIVKPVIETAETVRDQMNNKTNTEVLVEF